MHEKGDGHVVNCFNIYAENDDEAIEKARQRQDGGGTRSGILIGTFLSSNA